MKGGNCILNVIIHFPKTSSGKQELQNKVANVHVEGAKNYIQQLPCPKEQKVELFEALKQASNE
jgi:hypothetical protein